MGLLCVANIPISVVSLLMHDRVTAMYCNSTFQVDDELQSLIQSNSLQIEDVEEAVKKYSDQYYTEVIF